jgi:hypothetical protein
VLDELLVLFDQDTFDETGVINEQDGAGAEPTPDHVAEFPLPV